MATSAALDGSTDGVGYRNQAFCWRWLFFSACLTLGLGFLMPTVLLHLGWHSKRAWFPDVKPDWAPEPSKTKCLEHDTLLHYMFLDSISKKDGATHLVPSKACMHECQYSVWQSLISSRVIPYLGYDAKTTAKTTPTAPLKIAACYRQRTFGTKGCAHMYLLIWKTRHMPTSKAQRLVIS